MNITKEEVQQVLAALHADPNTSDWDDAITLLQSKLAEPRCKDHPDAPHGFDRNASHSEDRYVCECEGWEPEKEEVEPVVWAAQERVSRKWYYIWHEEDDVIGWVRLQNQSQDNLTFIGPIPLFTHPAKQVPMTDAEIRRIQARHPTENDPLPFARAIEKHHGIGS